MSDYNSSLPVRTQADGSDERLHVKVVDGTNPAVNQMTVDSDKNAHIEVHGNDAASTDRVLILSEEGRIVPRGDYHAAQNSKPGSVATILHSRQSSPTEVHQTFRPSGIAGSDGDNARCLDVAIRDEDGNKFTASNPLPVTFVDSEGAEINDYSTSANVAAAASSNHDYAVTSGKTLKLAQINCSASGKAKFEIQVESGVATGTFSTKFVLFNSTSMPSVSLVVREFISISAGVRVRVIRTNKDNQAQDVYSTISGHEI